MHKPNMSLKKTEMAVQNLKTRVCNFDEVALGYTEQQAVEEAFRCLNCASKPCTKKCPVAINIPAFVEQVRLGNFEKAFEIISESSSLPAICGRVCPQELQCESGCVRSAKGESVAIGRLERFVADWHAKNCEFKGLNLKIKKNKKKVGVVGSGPAGLACAGELAKFGFDVEVFEALHLPGGVLVYGIPEFRLPKKIVAREVENLKKLGVKVQTNVFVGRTFSLADLFKMGFEALFIGIGAGIPRALNIEGENLNGVSYANEFLTRINLMGAFKKNASTPIHRAKRFAIVGGGNVAIDAARSAKRLGADEVFLIYRKGEENMSARLEEIENARDEGIVFKTFCKPKKFCGDENGFVKKIVCVETKPEQSADFEGLVNSNQLEFELEVDGVVVAIGTLPNAFVRSKEFGLEVNDFGGVVVDEKTGLTSKSRIYAGGDVVSGSATVILAMEAGKKAARAICEKLKSSN